MDKYGDIEKSYRENLDSWLCNLYFSIEQRDTLANPYSVQLVLDEETQERIKKKEEKFQEDEKSPVNQIKLNLESCDSPNGKGGSYGI